MSDYDRSRHGYPRHVPAERPPGSPAFVPGRASGRSPYAEPDRSGIFPRIDDTDPRAPIGPPLTEYPAPSRAPTYQDLVVPRIFVEPDEQMDALRARALRMAIFRDVFLVVFLIVATFYLGALIFGGGR